MRNAGWVVAIAVLFLTGVAGLSDGPGDFRGANTGWQFTVAIGVTLYGVTGLVAAVGLALRKRWSLRVAQLWGAVITYTAAVASFAYTEAEVSVGTKAFAAIAGGVVTAIIAALIVWAARVATRAPATIERANTYSSP